MAGRNNNNDADSSSSKSSLLLQNFASFSKSSSNGNNNFSGGGGLNSILVHKLGILQLPLSPMYNNIFSALLTILYVKLVLEIAAYVRYSNSRNNNNNATTATNSATIALASGGAGSSGEEAVEWSRKLVHFAACSFVLFWPLFDPSHWGWRLNITVPVVMSLRLLYKVSC